MGCDRLRTPTRTACSVLAHARYPLLPISPQHTIPWELSCRALLWIGTLPWILGQHVVLDGMSPT